MKVGSLMAIVDLLTFFYLVNVQHCAVVILSQILGMVSFRLVVVILPTKEEECMKTSISTTNKLNSEGLPALCDA